MRLAYKKWFVALLATLGLLTVVSIAGMLKSQSFSQVWTDPSGDAAGGWVGDRSLGESVTIDVVPGFVDITEVFLNIPQSGVLQVGLRVAEPIPLSSEDQFCYDFYFDGDGDGYWDVIVFSTHGNYTYDSSPPKPPNSAGVMDFLTGTLLGDAQLSVFGNTVIITLDHSLVNNSTRLLQVVSHYAPGYLTNAMDLTFTDGWKHPDIAPLMTGVRGHEIQ